MIVVFVGPPGSGKSTQATRLAGKCGIPHLEMGELLRELSTQDSAIGREVRSYIDRGLLVPEPIVKQLIAGRLRQPGFQRGFVIDGFPRNVSQAKAFDQMLADMHLKLDRVVLFEVPEEVVVERLSGRRICASCGAAYHVKFGPPRIENRCDRCAGRLIQRNDDRPDVAEARLRVFAHETAPLVAFYEGKNLLSRIDASRSVDEVFANLQKIVSCD